MKHVFVLVGAVVMSGMTPVIAMATPDAAAVRSGSARPDFSGLYAENITACAAAMAQPGTAARAIHIAHTRDSMAVRVTPQQTTRFMRIARAERALTASGVPRSRLLHWDGNDLVIVSPASVPALWADRVAATRYQLPRLLVERFSIAGGELTYAAAYVADPENGTIAFDTVRLPRCAHRH
jgi:hypothetical protein